jgi:PleD family two-component response regulator
MLQSLECMAERAWVCRFVKALLQQWVGPLELQRQHGTLLVRTRSTKTNIALSHESKMAPQHQEPYQLVKYHDTAHVDDEVRSLNVLVAEDNKINQKVVTSILKRLGHSVTIAETGLEAVKALEEGCTQFDIVLMDVQMPVMDGTEATRQIRQKGWD